jgi:hypothetical protein
MLPGHFIFFGLPGSPYPFFRSPQKEGLERREAPGSVRSSPCDRPVRAKIPGPKCAPRGWGSRGAGPCEGPGASRRSNAMPVVGHRILLPLETPSTASAERT